MQSVFLAPPVWFELSGQKPVAIAKTAHRAVFIRGNPFVRFLLHKNAAACRLSEPHTTKIKKLTTKM